jgi:hypothetical protein
MSTFDMETKQLPDGRLLLEMRGKIDEGFDGRKVATATRGKPVVLHLGGVRHVSSIGIREFESFIELVTQATLIEVSPAIASHLVLLPTLAARVKVESAQLPFSCRSCGAEQTAVVPFVAGAHETHAPTCASCGQRMQLDGLAEQYLPSP